MLSGLASSFCLQLLAQKLGLLLLDDLLHAEEFLSRLLVDLLVDVGDDVLDAGDEDVLQGVHTPAGHLDLLIEGLEGCLQGREPHKQRHGLEVRLPTSIDDSAAMCHAERLDRCVFCRIVRHLECGNADTCHIFIHELAHNTGPLCPLHNRRCEVITRVCPMCFRQRERCIFQTVPHCKFCVDNVFQQKLKLGFQCIPFFLQQFETLRGAAKARLKGLQGHTVRSGALPTRRHLARKRGGVQNPGGQGWRKA
mmetsp:Transcript_60475/g.194720  ORF Transcript_60475/g.194720 Transcript_60475/m.194720 type:complete len:252 (-) Transcript_60475:2-757(-)